MHVIYIIYFFVFMYTCENNNYVMTYSIQVYVCVYLYIYIYIHIYIYICIYICICSHTAIDALLYMCPHTAIYVSSYCYRPVLILL